MQCRHPMSGEHSKPGTCFQRQASSSRPFRGVRFCWLRTHIPKDCTPWCHSHPFTISHCTSKSKTYWQIKIESKRCSFEGHHHHRHKKHHHARRHHDDTDDESTEDERERDTVSSAKDWLSWHTLCCSHHLNTMRQLLSWTKNFWKLLYRLYFDR